MTRVIKNARLISLSLDTQPNAFGGTVELVGMPCVNCEVPFDPIKHRWLCPNCKHKNSCCEGAPL